jgi:hypothetical protein
MGTVDYSKDYRGEPQSIKTTDIILTKADGTEITLDADKLEELIGVS